MIVGHVGLALVGASQRPRVPLTLLVAVSFGPDLVQIALGASGIGDPGELRSHALAPAVLWASGVALLYHLVSRDARAAGLLFLVYLSHLPADYITGHKPSWPSGPTIGLGWYAQPILDFTVEALVLLYGYVLWRRTATPHRARTTSILAVLLLLQLLFDLRRLELL
ncbi:MAG TPA: hypothetical protein VFY16_08175 [Gemmatimonadaceae bacterium]|jgi:hypothetical protein|nr:hypothetical protein [Gemmatimonadaceae bacterium]